MIPYFFPQDPDLIQCTEWIELTQLTTIQSFFNSTVQSVAPYLIHCTLFKSCSEYRIINFLMCISVVLLIQSLSASQTLLNWFSQPLGEVRWNYYPHFTFSTYGKGFLSLLIVFFLADTSFISLSVPQSYDHSKTQLKTTLIISSIPDFYTPPSSRRFLGPHRSVSLLE